MNFEFVCIYNPDFGTEENVDPQVVYSSPSNNDYIKLIGVAQGIVELAHSFGEKPAKWFRTGRKSQSKLTLVVPLICENKDNWRSGFWFTGQLPINAEVPPPEIAYRLVHLAFNQHLLKHGPPLISPSGNNAATDAYWSAFASQNFDFEMPSVIAPEAIRIAPGLLNPSAKREVERIRDENSVIDIMITTVGDGSAVYAGEKLELKTRIAIQRWLERTIPRPSPTTSSDQMEAQNEIQDRTQEFNPEPSPIQDSGQDEVHEQGDLEQDESQKHAPQTPVDHNHGKQQENHSSKTSWFSGSNFFSNMPQLPSWSVPSMPSMPAMPSMASLSLNSLPSLGSVSTTDWWKSTPKQENVSDGFWLIDVELYNVESAKKLYVHAWRHALYNYIAISEAPVKEDSNGLNSMFYALSSHLDGFSFAFEPPTKFHYLILDVAKFTVVSTFHTYTPKEVVRSLIKLPKESQQVMRLGSTWLYSVIMANGVYAMFGKKNITTQQPNLLGALHSDVQQWLDEYERKYL